MTFIPSAYQQAVFDWVSTGSGNAIINAVAGSGKTTTLVEATKRISSNTRVLFVAFNKNIVQALQARLPKGTACKTIHSIGYACIGNQVGKIELDNDKYIQISFPYADFIHKELVKEYDQSARQYLLDAERNSRNSKSTPLAGWNQPWDTNMSSFKNKETDREIPILPPPREVIAARLRDVAHYVRVSLVDYNNPSQIDEIVNHFGVDIEFDYKYLHKVIPRILETGLTKAREERIIDFDDMLWLPAVWQLLPQSFDWVLVDEVQDLSAAQFSLVQKVCRNGGRLLAVGDPYQAIYGFAGASHDSFFKIKELTNANEFPLSICYRCPTSVVELAKTIVPSIESSPISPKGVVKEESISVAVNGLRAGDFVICRFTAPLIGLCISLIGKRKAAHVLGRDIGKQLTDIIEEVTKMKGFTYSSFLEFLDRLFNSKYEKLSRQKNAEDRIRSLQDRFESIRICYESFESKSTGELIGEIRELFKDENDSITLSTIHKAKGLEYDRVFILSFAEMPYSFPGQLSWQVQQELNLKYVAVTRAKKELLLLTTAPPEKPNEKR